MYKIWVGDFRTNMLKAVMQTKADADNNKYFFEDSAEYQWFSSTAINLFGAELAEKSSVMIMLGFNDCVNSCVWNALKIDTLAENYAKVINDLIQQHLGINFYFCSVNPVDADYPFSGYLNGTIPRDTLNNKIKKFNSKIKEKVKATYIDSYKYLNSTSFSTQDGVRFSLDMAASILEYVSLYINMNSGTTFMARATPTAAPVEHDYSYSDELAFWRGKSNQGYNPFEKLTGHKYHKYVGDTLPNCTAYAWGRFYEILNDEPSLSTDKVELWYTNTNDGYQRGQDPAIGAIMCWKGNSSANTDGKGGRGHVAIVEKINSDGSILTSESAWQNEKYWWITERKKGNDGRWGQSSAYTFQGFIYCPLTTTVTEENLCTENTYLNKGSIVSLDGKRNLDAWINGTEVLPLANETIADYVYTPSADVEKKMKPNARYIWQYLYQKGWSVNAVAALLGNIHQESTLSPGVWQGIPQDCENINEITGEHSLTNKGKNFSDGYGLVQWTPSTKYTEWCTEKKLDYWKMDSQLQRIIHEVKNKIQWGSRPKKGYNLSFEEFTTSTKDAAWLAEAFVYCYERPASTTASSLRQLKVRIIRGKYASYWYNYLNSISPFSETAKNTGLHVSDFRITTCSSTSASASFISRNATNATYILNKEDSKNITLSDDFTTFKIDKLIPNKKYSLALNVEADNSDDFSKIISFTTPQSLPSSLTNLSISISKNEVLPYNNFKLTAEPSKVNFGYWQKNSKGYNIQLIVNGLKKSEKELNSLPSSINIQKDFGYSTKLGDTIQVGLRVWTKDDRGNKLYDSSVVKMSNSICLLSKPIQAYLNTN